MVAMAVRRSPREDVLNHLMKRCVECPPDQPSCPNCDTDETCSLIPQSCTACAYTVCVKVATIPGQTLATKNPEPVGGIVGGVVAGVVAIVLITYLVWRFCLRGRRQRNTWEPPEKTTITRSGTVRSTTHSIASTVLTRASNVIQIAYIPGVTVRSTPETPEIPPPMPSIPSSYANTSANTSPEIEQHFFMPSRDSTWSQATSIATDNRISLTPSLARASVATTIYGGDVIMPPIPAQYVYSTQANVVSVRSGSSTPNTMRGSSTPPVPQMPRVQQLQTINGSQIVARNVTVRPVEIKKNPSPGNAVPTLGNLAKRNSNMIRKTTIPVFSDEKEVVMSPATIIEDYPSSSLNTPGLPYSNGGPSSTSGISALLPTSGPLSGGSTSAQRRDEPTDDISAMIQNALKSAASNTSVGPSRPELHKQDSGPFSDANEIKENTSPR